MSSRRTTSGSAAKSARRGHLIVVDVEDPRSGARAEEPGDRPVGRGRRRKHEHRHPRCRRRRRGRPRPEAPRPRRRPRPLLHAARRGCRRATRGGGPTSCSTPTASFSSAVSQGAAVAAGEMPSLTSPSSVCRIDTPTMTLVASIFEQLDYEDWLRGSTESARVTVPLVLDEDPGAERRRCRLRPRAWLAVFKEYGVEDRARLRRTVGRPLEAAHHPGEFRAADFQRAARGRTPVRSRGLPGSGAPPRARARRAVRRDPGFALRRRAVLRRRSRDRAGSITSTSNGPATGLTSSGPRDYVATDPFRVGSLGASRT